MSDSMIAVGQIVKPQGIRGELKVRPLTEDPSRFCVLKSVTVGGRPYRVTNVRVTGRDVFIMLDGVADRNSAETLRGEYVNIDRAAAVELKDGEFFIADLIGAELYASSQTGSERVGVIERIDSYGAADVFSVSCGEKGMTFAFIKALDAVFDANARTLTVDKQRLSEVAVYED